MSWSDRWAYSMAQITPTNTRDFGGFIQNAAEATEGIPGVGMATNEIQDFVGDAQDAWGDSGSGWDQFTNAVEVVTPEFIEDVGTNGLFNDNSAPPQPTQAPAPTPAPTNNNNATNEDGMWGISMPGTSCPDGFMPNPNPTARSLGGAGCVPVNTSSGVSTTKPPGPVPGFDEDCEPIPKEYPPPSGCIPGVQGESSTFFKQQRLACTREWKVLEGMEEEIKARYEQLCMARERFTQRKNRYGGMCGPYELLYGISEEKEKEALAKEKAKKECLKKTQPCGSGCGCINKTSTGCGCGCTGKHSTTTTSTSEDMDFEYEDPIKSACKRAVDESFKTTTAKRVTPARAAKSSCMPCMAGLKQQPVYRTTVRRLPANTIPPPPKAKKTTKKKAPPRKAVLTKTKKRQCVLK